MRNIEPSQEIRKMNLKMDQITVDDENLKKRKTIWRTNRKIL